MLAFGKAAAWKFRYCFRNFLTQLKGSNWSSMAVKLNFYLYLEFVYLIKMEQSVFWFVSRSAKKIPALSFLCSVVKKLHLEFSLLCIYICFVSQKIILVILSIPFYLEHITSCSISKNLELVPFQFQGLTIGTSSILFLYNNWNSGL